jgi:hypothetical protein
LNENFVICLQRTNSHRFGEKSREEKGLPEREIKKMNVIRSNSISRKVKVSLFCLFNLQEGQRKR